MLRRIFLLLLLASPALADQHDEGGDNRSVELSVKPVLCITDSITPVCEMAFLVYWRSNESGYYCVFNDFAESALRCWSEEQTGELNDERTVDSDFSYWVTGSDETSRLAIVTVEVLRMDSGDRRRNRRTRHVWDLL